MKKMIIGFVLAIMVIGGLAGCKQTQETVIVRDKDAEIVIHNDGVTIFTTVQCAEPIYHVNLDDENVDWEYMDWSQE